MVVLDIRAYQEEVHGKAQALGHAVGEWVVVDQGDAGKDYHLTCPHCGAMFSVRLVLATQATPGMTITMHSMIVGISDAGMQACAMQTQTITKH